MHRAIIPIVTLFCLTLIVGCKPRTASVGVSQVEKDTGTAPIGTPPKATDADKEKPSSVKRKPDHVMTVEAYLKEWNDDPTTAKVKYKYEYKGAEVWVQLTGRVWHVGNYSTNGGMVMLRGEDDKGMAQDRKIGCIFEALKDCAHLREGEQVTICGRCFTAPMPGSYAMLMTSYVAR